MILINFFIHISVAYRCSVCENAYSYIYYEEKRIKQGVDQKKAT